MKSNLARLLLSSLLIISAAHRVFAGAVSVGSGSYTDTLPAGRLEMQTTMYVTANISAPVPTSDWWTFLLTQGAGANCAAFPLFLMPVNDGLNINLPKDITSNPDYLEYDTTVKDLKLQGLVSGTAITASSVMVDKYSDWTVTPQWKNGSDYFNATFGHGLPFVYAEYFGNAQPSVTLLTNNSGDNKFFYENGSFSTTVTTVTDHIGLMTRPSNIPNYYGLFAPQGSTFEITPTTIKITLPPGKNYFSIGILTTHQDPDVTIAPAQAELAEYYQHAYAFITDTKIAWAVDTAKSKVTTTFTATVQSKQGNQTTPYLMAFPHQWKNSTSSFDETKTFKTLRGTLKLIASNTFTVTNSFNGILPFLPERGTYDKATLKTLLDADKTTQFWAETSGIWTSYGHGKEVGRMACLIPIANQSGEDAARTYLLGRLTTDLENWFTYTPGETLRCFYYNSHWGGMIAYQADFDEDQFTDQHFHFGYFIYASAILGLYDRDFINGYGGMVELLINSMACPARNDPKFPFLRNLDPYEGHSWADSGVGAYQIMGNNQESTSEAMNAWAGIYLWGLATGNNTYRDLGIYGYTTEYSAIREYWFDVGQAQYGAPFNHKLVSIVKGTQAVHGTFFDSRPEAIHGIQVFPLTPSSLYPGYTTGYAQINYQEMLSESGGAETEWYDTLWKYQALYDPATAITKYNSSGGSISYDPGNSRTYTYYWLHNLNGMGLVDTSVYSDYPASGVFNKNGTKLYTAFNPNDSAVTAKFYNRSDNSLIGSISVSSHTTVSTSNFASFKTEYVPVTGTLASNNPVNGSTTTVVNQNVISSSTYTFGSWSVTIGIPEGAFSESVTMSVSSASAPAARETMKITNICVDLSLDKALQPLKDITITLSYTDADVAGFDTSKLIIAYYDAPHDRWLSIPSVPYPALKKVVGTVRHLSKFAIGQLIPAGGLDAVKAYPMPYGPANGLLVIDNLTQSAEIKIYDVAGELIRTVDYASANGRASWDGKNDAGSTVASGIYVMYIESPEGKKRLKIAVER